MKRRKDLRTFRFGGHYVIRNVRKSKVYGKRDRPYKKMYEEQKNGLRISLRSRVEFL